MQARLCFLPLLAALIASCSQMETKSGPGAPAVSERALQGHIEFLAADSLQGRDTGTVGYQVAADYVAAEFLKLGLVPGGDNGSYFQQVPLVEINKEKDSLQAVIHGANGDVELKYPEQFIMGPDHKRASASVNAELVFVGYGIVAPQFDHDDYAGLDVAGKIVVMLEGRPEAWPTEEGAHLASGRQKARHAAEAGAVGRIILQTPRAAKTFPWEVNYTYLDVSSMNWVGPDGNQIGRAHV